jgi:hypothetical protein
MAWPAVKKGFNQSGFARYVKETSWPQWRPSKIVWHNTAAPSLKQWIKSAQEDERKGLVPGLTRIQNLERYFRVNNGWSGCPHLFIANDLIWVMNPLDKPGVHSPSWNSTSIGIEMIGDFASEDDDSGEGLKVKNNTIFATALLCELLGLNPHGVIFLHKEDPRTTHDCPGKNIAQDKKAMIMAVADLMEGGEHDAEEVGQVIAGQEPPDKPVAKIGMVLVNDLNMRVGPGVANSIRGVLNKGQSIEIQGEAKNGTTTWLYVKTPGNYYGWVSGHFVERRDT